MAWKISGQYMETCNCAYLCPCIYTNPQGPATHDHCTAVLVFRIDEGHADDVSLAGCKFAFVLRTGRVMADGNWVFANVVDAATDAQRAALAKIAGGEAGGTPQAIRTALVSDYRGVVYKAIEVVIDGAKRTVSIPDVLRFSVSGVEARNRPGEVMHIDNTSHPANRRLALARADAMEVSCLGINESLLGQGNNGHFAPFAWAG